MGKFSKTFICESTGIKTIYHYQDSIVRGIESVEIEYPKDYLDALNKKEKQQSALPKTKQMFLNPKTGKEVGYYRAKNLGLVK